MKKFKQVYNEMADKKAMLNDQGRIIVWNEDTGKVVLTGSPLDVLINKMGFSAVRAKSIINSLAQRGSEIVPWKNDIYVIEIN